ncbi:LEF-4 [Urbanus proteus nucleopolyhedrovirus]|uniref:LEF-4 n=1 Tax=Urbanus proteus nucleopolyhedrovirus TaxID=1675866 RepID=A0A162GTZ9_9ABAC|nr:LEF-4 [Urbanus proteus nucleopolyhedrovirus]AKR17308.1 LEF-4 [Urbanus proteus nucleopolyhedrovirus]
MTTIEKEVSYTINLSQELLYKILRSYIYKRFKRIQKYVDFYDTNSVRTRMYKDVCCSQKKITLNTQKFVYARDNVILPLVNRVSEESTTQQAHTELKRIVMCHVYVDEKVPDVEIKFEQTYMNAYASDKFDSLMASKQITLLNLLMNTDESVEKQTFLGSDEILANIRIEYEYENYVCDTVLSHMASIICDMNEYSRKQNISPLFAYTTLLNNIIYRKFEQEHVIDTPSAKNINIFRWAHKLDGVRGRGFYTRNFVLVCTDDMQIFTSFDPPPMFTLNNVVAFQCEYLPNNNCLYVTDLLHVFKYTYNNRTQYECSFDAYNIDANSAVSCIEFLHAQNFNFSLYTNDNVEIKVLFQKFYLPPILFEYSTLPTDGYVVLNTDQQYNKIKYELTKEVEYDDVTKKFKNIDHIIQKRYKFKNDMAIELVHGSIYESVERDDCLIILKKRCDRVIPN